MSQVQSQGEVLLLVLIKCTCQSLNDRHLAVFLGPPDLTCLTELANTVNEFSSIARETNVIEAHNSVF